MEQEDAARCMAHKSNATGQADLDHRRWSDAEVCSQNISDYGFSMKTQTETHYCDINFVCILKLMCRSSRQAGGCGG